ncbi:HK97 family phage major capsid protein [Geodermatophilus bullaregiensis]|uniref:phage major capsid protein n=1 Tax=Geodermatophilus bullaregiensis TaxID=1564160 RepID=UPI0019575AD6|nr:phage major capsid protein [Geodermatophilus bullaregiensis]MBM7807658.1 HK97 family phage major capsid protein [Geodermatophilus bullaregiensis]
MTMTRANGAVILTPAQVAELLVQPVGAESVAMQVATVVNTGSSVYRIPLVTADPQAAWVSEGDEIAPSDAVLSEEDVHPSKVAGLTIVTRELAEDSSPEAAATVGAGLARDIARKVDAAFFGNLASPAPAGLGSLAVGAGNVQAVDAGAAFASLDPFAEAQSLAEGVGALLTSFVANPVDALALTTLKVSTGSNQTLLGGQRSINGVPLLTSPSVPAGTIYGIPQDRAVVVVREDATVETDSSVFFTSDRVAVKAVMRVGFGFNHLAALVKITTGPD